MGNVEIQHHKRQFASFRETAFCNGEGTGKVFESEEGMYFLVFYRKLMIIV